MKKSSCCKIRIESKQMLVRKNVWKMFKHINCRIDKFAAWISSASVLQKAHTQLHPWCVFANLTVYMLHLCEPSFHESHFSLTATTLYLSRSIIRRMPNVEIKDVIRFEIVDFFHWNPEQISFLFSFIFFDVTKCVHLSWKDKRIIKNTWCIRLFH